MRKRIVGNSTLKDGLEAQTHDEIEHLIQLEDYRLKKQDRELQKKLVSRVFWLIVCWLAFLAAVILLNGFGWKDFHLADEVLEFLIVGTTTGAIVGFLGMVLRYYFSLKHKKQQAT